MSTSAQVNANRENAKHSTGPTSEAGKATSRQNGLKHGLASSELIIRGESVEAFNEMLAALIAEHQPATITETLLVQDMAKHHWLADRAINLQSMSLNIPPPPFFALLIRYQTANERAFHKSLAALNALRKTRLAEIGSASKNAPAPPPHPDPVDPAHPPSIPKILEMFAQGFEYDYLTGKYNRIETA